MGEIFESNSGAFHNDPETGNKIPVITGNQDVDAKLNGMTNDERDEYFKQLNAPLKGEEIADLLQNAGQNGYKPTKEEFQTFKAYRDTIATDYLKNINDAATYMYGEGLYGLKHIATAGAGNPEALLMGGISPYELAESFARGTRNLGGMLLESEDPNSIFFKSSKMWRSMNESAYPWMQQSNNPDDLEYNTFLDALNFRLETEKLANGDETLLVGKNHIDNRFVEAASTITDPSWFVNAEELTIPLKLLTKGIIGVENLQRFNNVVGKAGAITNKIKNGVLGGALKFGGMPIEFIGNAVRGSIDTATELGGKAFNGLTGVPINDFKATAKLGTIGAGVSGIDVPLVAGAGKTYLGASLAIGVGEAMQAIGTQIMKGERGFMSYAEMALKESVENGVKLTEPAKNILKLIQSADPLFSYASNFGKGALHGAIVGGALGYLSDEEEGLSKGIGAGLAMGSMGALVSSTAGSISDASVNARAATQAKLVMESLKEHNPDRYNFFKAYYDYIETKRNNDPRLRALADKMVSGLDQIAPDVALHLLDPKGYLEVANRLGLDENARVRDATIGSLSNANPNERAIILSLLRDYSGRYAGRPEDFQREAESDVRELSPKQQELLKTKVEPRPQEPAQLHTDLPYGSQERIDSYNQSRAVKEWDAKYDETHFRNGHAKPAWMLKDVEARPTQYQMPYDQWKRLNPEEQQKVSKKQQDSKWDVSEWDRKYADTHDYTGKPLKGESLYFPDTPDRLANVKSLEQDAVNKHESQLREPQGPIKLQAIKQKWGSLSETGKRTFLDILKQHSELFKEKTNKEASAYYGDLLAAENARKAVLKAHNGNIDTNQVPDTLKAQKLAKDFLDAERNPDGSLTQRGKMIKTKLQHEGFVDENGNIMQRREAQRLPITLADLKSAKGITPERDANGRVHIYLNSDNMTRDTFPHELFHAIMRETAMRDMFIKPLVDKLLGTWKDGKQVSKPVVNLNEVYQFLDNYYKRLNKAIYSNSNKIYTPEAHQAFMENIKNAIDEYKNWDNSKTISNKTLALLHNAVEEFGANYFSHWLVDTPPDYLFRGGDLTGLRGIVDDVKYAWADYWESKMKYENPQFDFSGNLERGFFDKAGNRIKNASLDYMMRDILRAKANMNKGVWSPLRMSPDAVKAYVRGNGMANVIKTDVAGRPKLLKESEAEKLNRAAGIAINKIIEGLPPEDRVGLKKDADGNWTGRLNSKILDMIVQSGWRDRAWADKIEHAYRIIDGNAENVVEAGYLGATAQITDASWPRLTGKDVPFKNRKFLLYDATTKIGPDGTFHVLLHSLDMHVIENRANALWSNQEYRDLWYGNRGAMEADFFKYVQNASKPSSERLQSANLLNNGDGKGAERRNVLHQMLGMAKTDDNPYFNKPIAEIPQGWRQSITTFNIDRMTQMRTRAGERFDYNPENAHIALSHNWSPADMEYENTSNGQILKHDSEFKFIRVGNSTQAFDNLGRNLGSFRTAEEAAKASKKLFDTRVNNQEQGGQKLLEQNYERIVKFSPALSDEGKDEAFKKGDVYDTDEMKAFVKGRPLVAGGLTRQELIKNYWHNLIDSDGSKIKTFITQRYKEIKVQINNNNKQISVLRKKINNLDFGFRSSDDAQRILQNKEYISADDYPSELKSQIKNLTEQLKLLDSKNDLFSEFINTFESYTNKNDNYNGGFIYDKSFIVNMLEESNQSILFGHLYDDQIQTGKPFVTTATHGTSSIKLLTNKIFSEESLGNNTLCLSAEMGTFFAGSQETSTAYADKVKHQLRAAIAMDNPLVVSFPRAYDESFLSQHIQRAINGGYDGVVFKQLADPAYPDTIFCVLKGKTNDNIKVIESSIDKINRVPRGKMPDGSKPISIYQMNNGNTSHYHEFLAFSPNEEEPSQEVKQRAKEAGYRPTVYYHGTNRDFNVFDANAERQYGEKRNAGMFFFTPRLDEATNIHNDTSKVMPVFLKADNPFNTDLGKSPNFNVSDTKKIKDYFYKNANYSGDRNYLMDVLDGYLERNEFGTAIQKYLSRPQRIELLESLGYDSLLDKGEHIVVFHPEQIKSAKSFTYDDKGNEIPLSQRFDKNNPDIRYSPANNNYRGGDDYWKPRNPFEDKDEQGFRIRNVLVDNSVLKNDPEARGGEFHPEYVDWEDIGHYPQTRATREENSHEWKNSGLWVDDKEKGILTKNPASESDDVGYTHAEWFDSPRYRHDEYPTPDSYGRYEKPRYDKNGKLIDRGRISIAHRGYEHFEGAAQLHDIKKRVADKLGVPVNHIDAYAFGFGKWKNDFGISNEDKLPVKFSPADESSARQPIKIKSELEDLVKDVFGKYKHLNANGFANKLQQMGGERGYKGFKEAQAIGLIDHISRKKPNENLDPQEILQFIKDNGIDLNVERHAKSVDIPDTSKYVSAGTRSNYEDIATRINEQHAHGIEGHFGGGDVVVHTRLDDRINSDTGEKHTLVHEVQANNVDKSNKIATPEEIEKVRKKLAEHEALKSHFIKLGIFNEKNGHLRNDIFNYLHDNDASKIIRQRFDWSNPEGEHELDWKEHEIILKDKIIGKYYKLLLSQRFPKELAAEFAFKIAWIQNREIKRFLKNSYESQSQINKTQYNNDTFSKDEVLKTAIKEYSKIKRPSKELFETHFSPYVTNWFENNKIGDEISSEVKKRIIDELNSKEIKPHLQFDDEVIDKLADIYKLLADNPLSSSIYKKEDWKNGKAQNKNGAQSFNQTLYDDLKNKKLEFKKLHPELDFNYNNRNGWDGFDDWWNSAITNSADFSDNITNLKTTLKQLENSLNPKKLPLSDVKEWSIISLKNTIERAIESGSQNVTLTHPFDSPPHSFMKPNAAQRLYGEIIPSAWKEWLKKYNIEVKQLNPDAKIDIPWDTKNKNTLINLKNEYSDLAKDTEIKRRKLKGTFETVVDNEELKSKEHPDIIHAIESWMNVGWEHFENINVYRDRIIDSIQTPELRKTIEAFFKSVEKEYEFILGNCDEDKLKQIMTDTALNRGMTFKINDKLRNDFANNNISIYRSPADETPRNITWQSENTSAGSIIKNTAGYVIMKSMSKYRVYNPYKALVGVYDDEKTAMGKINKLSRTPNELR